MAELKKKATRESYGEALAELGDKYEMATARVRARESAPL